MDGCILVIVQQETTDTKRNLIMTNTTITKTADEYRAEAAAHRAAEAESFARCDTDGFISQYVHTLNAREASVKARLAEQGGMEDFGALFHLDGTIASTHQADGEYGSYWVLNDEATARFGKRFVSLSRAKNGQRRYEANRAKGFTIGTIRVEAYTEMVGNGRGLGAIMTVRTVVKPNVEALKKGEFEVLVTDRGIGEDY